MFSISSKVTVAGVTEARRDMPGLLERVGRGESVILQKNSEPVGVLIGYELYKALVAHAGRAENAAVALTALERDERIMRGAEAAVPLSAMLRKVSSEGGSGGA